MPRKNKKIEKNKNLHFSVKKDINLGIYIPLNLFIALTPIIPVFYLFYLYLNIFDYNIHLGLIFLPLIIFGLYFLYIVGVVYLTKLCLVLSHWRCPPKEGINMERNFHDKNIYHYHLRGFLKKFPLWLILRSPFPFLVPWMFKTFGLYKIGKNVTIYDCWLGLEFIEIGDNSVIGIGSVLSSHLIDKMNNLTIKRVSLGENCQLGHYILVAPGAKVENNTIVCSHSLIPKFKHLEPNSVYKPGFNDIIIRKDLNGIQKLYQELEVKKKWQQLNLQV